MTSFIEGNAQVIDALKHTLSKDCLFIISHCDSAFAVWNTLTSPKEQTQHILERESRRDVSEQTCYMVQGIDSLEVKSDTHLENCVSSSCDNNIIDAHALNEELFMFCENLLLKYKVLI